MLLFNVALDERGELHSRFHIPLVGRIQMKVRTTLPFFFLIFLFPIDFLRKSKIYNWWKIIISRIKQSK